MTRRLSSLVTSFSLLACVAVTALWVRSYRVTDRVAYERTVVRSEMTRHDAETSITSRRGVVEFRSEWRYQPYSFGHQSPRWTWRRGPDQSVFALVLAPRAPAGPLPFEWERHADPWERLYLTRVAAPHWAFALPLGVAPTAWAFRRARRRLRRERGKRGLCPDCGYDLRATPDRCPECGAPVGGAGAAAPQGRPA
jgi:hypothetical protein